MSIILLSHQTICRIAAGEVIDSPAGVVKELLENCLDAGATIINIEIENGGCTSITISDNGSGIERDELELAFTKHATSKLTDDDISNICHLGFRGEALASIASVSRVELISKTDNEQLAWKISYEGSHKIGSITPASMSRGTKITVRDLFFSTPHRLRFLKSEKTETSQIIEIINRAAMLNHNVEFSLKINEKNYLHYYAQKNILRRLCDIKCFGADFENNSLRISHKRNELQVTGYVSVPTFHRGKSTSMYFYVNNRPIRDNVLSHAVQQAYSDVIPHGKYPIGVLHLILPCDTVDVNVHPNKLEVRFQDKGEVFKLISHALSSALSTPSIHTKAESVHDTHTSEIKIQNSKPTPYVCTSVIDTHCSEPISDISQYAIQTPKQTPFHQTLQHSSKEHIVQSILFTHPPLGYAIAQIHQTYILSQAVDGFFVIDQHAAHERIVYENLKKSFEDSNGVTQQSLLTPELIITETEYEIEILQEHLARLQKLGFVIEVINCRNFIIKAVPAIWGITNLRSTVQHILDSLVEMHSTFMADSTLNEIYSTIACHGSIRAGRKMTIEEMNHLLRTMEKTHNAGQCNHGRPTYIHFAKNKLDSMFERL